MILPKMYLPILTLFIGFTVINAQNTDKFCYPDGLYKTKEDFINKKPSEVRELTVKKIELVNDSDSVIRRCFFLDKATSKKIKKVFAVSYNGNLYFSNWAILKNKNKDDKSLSPASSMNSFVLVTISGSKYLYAEAGLINHWQAGLSSGVAGGVGGIAGTALGEVVNSSFPETTDFGTGVVWDFENMEFNIFRNCPDFNEFIEGFPVEKVDCGNELFDLSRIREAIQVIKK
jgi:hypothetical protein